MAGTLRTGLLLAATLLLTACTARDSGQDQRARASGDQESTSLNAHLDAARVEGDDPSVVDQGSISPRTATFALG